MSPKQPKLGENVVNDLGTVVVSDAEVQDLLAKAEQEQVQQHEEAPKDSVPTALIEGKGRMRIQDLNPPGTQSYLVHTLDGEAHHHCAEAVDGEWIYR